jgi:hypothetical protein
MKKIIFLILLYNSYHLFGQDTVITKQISSSSFVDCYSYKNGLAALAVGGKIYQINLTDYSSSILSSYSFSAIAIDRNGILWGADSSNFIYSLRDTGWKFENAIATQNIWDITFDNDDNLILFTDLGIYNSKTEMFYAINKNGKRWSSFSRGRFRPYCYYVDYKNDLWIGSNPRGGSEILVFSFRSNKYITPEIKGLTYIHLIQSIFGNKKTVFFARRDMFGMSAIYSYKKDTMKTIHHPEYDTMTIGPSKEAEEYIGAAFINKDGNEIYYYSNQGLLKAKYNSQKNKLETPVLIMPAQCAWTGYEFDPIDFVIRLKKMFLYQNQIVYLHKEEGIFIFNQHSLYNLR